LVTWVGFESTIFMLIQT